MARGRLIVFEGIEGAGKTTQIKLLAERLAAAGIVARGVREPGGTPVGDDIREILLHPEKQITPATEALLFMASRAELVSRELVPALEDGVIVLVDRFFLSTYAYQVYGRGLPEAEIRAAMSKYPRVEEVGWVKEEPENRGAWTFMEPRLRTMFPDTLLAYFGRDESASPAVGSVKMHQAEEKELVSAALGIRAQAVPVAKGTPATATTQTAASQ